MGPNRLGYQLLLHAPLRTSLPPELGFTRAAGNNSYQTGPAVDGTTFIALNAGPNVPRFHYVPALGRHMLLVEPAATNLLFDSNFVDVAPADNIPDGWITGGGVAGVDYTTQANGPHGGTILQCEATAVANRGVYDTGYAFGATQHTASGWFRRPGTGGPDLTHGFHLNPGVSHFSIGTGPYDWTRFQGNDAPVGVGANGYVLQLDGTPSGVVQIALPQIETGTYATTFIPTSGGTATRAVEDCAATVDSAIQTAGRIRFLWSPGYPSTFGAANVVIFGWDAANNDYLLWAAAAKTLAVVNNGAVRATSAALTFGAFDTVFAVDVAYGPFGTRIGIDGTVTADATAWVDTGALDVHLGRRALGTHQSGAYADLSIWG